MDPQLISAIASTIATITNVVLVLYMIRLQRRLLGDKNAHEIEVDRDGG